MEAWTLHAYTTTMHSRGRPGGRRPICVCFAVWWFSNTALGRTSRPVGSLCLWSDRRRGALGAGAESLPRWDSSLGFTRRSGRNHLQHFLWWWWPVGHSIAKVFVAVSTLLIERGRARGGRRRSSTRDEEISARKQRDNAERWCVMDKPWYPNWCPWRHVTNRNNYKAVVIASCHRQHADDGKGQSRYRVAAQVDAAATVKWRIRHIICCIGSHLFSCTVYVLAQRK